MGVPNSWIVFVREIPNLKWRMTGGCPHFGKASSNTRAIPTSGGGLTSGMAFLDGNLRVSHGSSNETPKGFRRFPISIFHESNSLMVGKWGSRELWLVIIPCMNKPVSSYPISEPIIGIWIAQIVLVFLWKMNVSPTTTQKFVGKEGPLTYVCSFWTLSIKLVLNIHHESKQVNSTNLP